MALAESINSIFGADNSSSRSLYQIGTDWFWIEIWMYDYHQQHNPIQIPFNFVSNLCIEETIYDWSVNGYITIETVGEILERGAYPNEIKPEYRDSSLCLRTDGRNLISFKIHTAVNPTNQASMVDTGGTLDASDNLMSFDCVIYDIQDVSTDSSNKVRTFYFKDIRHQILSEQNLEWSTGQVAKQLGQIGPSQDIWTLPDEQRAVTCSAALSSIFSKLSPTGVSNPTPGSGSYVPRYSIQEPRLPIFSIDNNNWNAGNQANKILYTSPTNSKVIDDINYILNLAVSNNITNPSPLILMVGRRGEPGATITSSEYKGKIDKKWKLLSVEDFFKKSEYLQKDTILLDDNLIQNGMGLNVGARAYTKGALDDIKGTLSIISSKATNYHFAHMVSENDDNLANSPVVNYNFKEGSYKIHFAGNKIQDLITNTKQVGAGLYNFKTQPDNSQVILNVNNSKKTGKITNNVFLPQTFFPTNYSGMQMMKNLLFTGQSIYIQTAGMIRRQPGSFLHLFRPIPAQNKFDDRFFGQWFVIKVTHLFTKGSYVNDIVATKLDSYSKLFDVNTDIAP